jgi:hypothetical protein
MAKSTSAETDKEILFSLSVPFTNEIAATVAKATGGHNQGGNIGEILQSALGQRLQCTSKNLGLAPRSALGPTFSRG